MSFFTEVRRAFQCLCLWLIIAALAAPAADAVDAADVDADVQVLVSPDQIPNSNAHEPSYLPPGYDDNFNIESNDDNATLPCETRVQNGECNSNPLEMIKYCLMECFEGGDFGSIGYYEKDDNDHDHLACVNIHEEDEEEELLSCEGYEDIGECASDPGFMLL